MDRSNRPAVAQRCHTSFASPARPAWPLRPLAAACLVAWASAAPAATFEVNSYAELSAALGALTGNDTINVRADIAVTGSLGVIQTTNLVINGNGFTIDGGRTQRGLLVESGTVTVSNVTLQNLVAHGGNGGNELLGGGGGLGAGGAILVRTGASVVINDVNLVSNGAAGGAGGGHVGGGVARGGGGGGMGGDGAGTSSSFVSFGAGGGGGAFSDGERGTSSGYGGNGGGPAAGAGGDYAMPGGAGGDYSGGGGAGMDSSDRGGAGGWGGGGGGTGVAAGNVGGAGGFGGGGGGGLVGGAGGFGGGGGGGGTSGGAGGFGAGHGTNGAGAHAAGGGGAGMGGAIFVADGGRITVTGNLTVNGNSVNGGAGGVSAGGSTVAVGGTGSAFGSGIFLQGSSASLTFSPAAGATQTFSDNIADQAGSGGTGSIAVTKNGAGTTVFSGTNTYSGGTNIAAGTLQVGSGTNLGSGNVRLQGGTLLADGGAGSTVSLAQRVDFGVAGGALAAATGTTLSVEGGMILANGSTAVFGRTGAEGTIRLRSAASLAGNADVSVAAGTLEDSNGSLGTAAGLRSIRVEGGAVLDFAGHTSLVNNLLGTGTVRMGTGRLTLRGAAFGGTIEGSGGLTHSGVLSILSGANTYAGETRVASGVLQVGNGGGSGTLGTDAVVVSVGGTLRLNRNNVYVAGNVIAGSTGAILHQAGSGTTALTGNSSFNGTVNITAGTLQLGNGGATGMLGSAATYSLTSGSLVFNRSDDVTFGNMVTGSGTMVKKGTGTLILTGTRSHTGYLNLEAGTVQVDSAPALGSSMLRFTGGTLRTTSTMSLARPAFFMDGVAGRIAAAAGTTLTMTGNFDLRAGAAMHFGSATDTGTIVIDTSGGGRTGAGGSVWIDGGTVRAAATGGVNVLEFLMRGPNVVTHLQAGALLDMNSQPTTINDLRGAGTLRNDGATTSILAGNFAGSITGTGHLASSGPLVLTGNNDYTGMTTIAAGSSVQVGDGGTTGSLGSGSVTNDGTLVFQRSDAHAVANAISGTGTFTQAGRGNLVLTGANTYTGDTFVNAGTLSVNGSIVANTTVNSGGTLGGSGRTGNVTIAAGGTLAPGNSIGTLSVAGNLRFAAGSTYRVEAKASGESDRVNTLGAGTITIDGGTVDVQAGGAGYQRNTRYTILRSASGTTGTFSGATTNLAFLTPALAYEGNDVVLSLSTASAPAYASVAVTPNQRAVAGYLQGFAGAPGNAQAAALIRQVDNLTADEARSSFASLAGSQHASPSQVAMAVGRNFSASLAARSGFAVGGLGNAMNDWSRVHYASLDRSRFEPVATMSDVVAQAAPARGGELPLASAQERGFWAQAVGAGGSIDGDGNGAGSRYGSNGFVLGYDQPLDGRWLAGAALGYSNSRWNATSGSAASGKVESPQAGLYARYAGERFRVRLDGTIASHDFTTDRTVTVGSTSAAAASSHGGREWALGGQVEMPLQVGAWELRPLAGVRHASLAEDAFTETGPGNGNLTVAERTTRNTLLSAGMHFVHPFNEGRGGLELRAVASHLAGDNDAPVTASIAGQSGSFTAQGTPLKRDALTFGATFAGELRRGLSAYLDANYEVRGSGQDAYLFTAGVRVSF